MKYFTSIYFVYRREDGYSACYLKEFFKWIGFTYMDYCVYDAENTEALKLAENKFDIIVDMDGALSRLQKYDRTKISSQMVYLDTIRAETEKDLLFDLLEQLKAIVLREESCQLLNRLMEIYQEYNLASILYEYTFVLFQGVESSPHEGTENILEDTENILETVLEALEAELLYCREKCENSEGNRFIEYALYAKYNCQKQLNKLRKLQDKALKYSVEEFLKNVDEIYQYDQSFFKVEFLKARVSEMDRMYRPYARMYLETCIAQCPIEACKSYHYYTLAKWLEGDRQPYEAGKAYRLSYQKHPGNMKAVFKFAVDKLNKKEDKLAGELLQKMLKGKALLKYVLPRDLEYAFKTHMLLAEIYKDRTEYREEAKAILCYIESLKTPGQEQSFMKKMYPDQNTLEKLCDAMLQRLEARCLE